MQEPPSLSQVLRESYMAEARARQSNSQMNHSDAPSSHLQFHGSLKDKMEDSLGHGDPQFPDLSAFLSQEELDESVNLACQAIRQEPQVEKEESKASITPLTPSNSTPALNSSCEPPYVSLVNHSPALFAAPASVPLSHPAPDCKELPETHENWTADCKELKATTRQENTIRESIESSEGFNDFTGPVRNAPYGPETQSKKEFLNKAADFIEELSSLFKANSTKRVRPRSCKTYRNKNQSKSQHEDAASPLSHENRERALMPMTVKKERPSPAASYPPKVQMDSESGNGECQDFRTVATCDTLSQEVQVEADSSALTESPHPGPACEPPHFIQKLKSREVPEGIKVQLDCTVQGLPVPEVRWFCEGKELETSPNVQIIADGDLHSMVISEAFEEDTGRYSCFASNCYGTDSTSAEIYVEGASSSDSEVDHNVGHVAQSQRKSLPQSSSQTVSAEEGPPSARPASGPERPSEHLSSLPTNPITLEGPLPVQTTATILLVPELSKTPSRAHLIQDEEEEETAVRSFPVEFQSDTEPSAAQDVSASVSVISTSSPVMTATTKATSLPLNSVTFSMLPVPSSTTYTPQAESQTSNNNHIQVMDEKQTMAAPVFTKSLQELLASEGQLVVLECRVKGGPSPQVDWYRDGKLVEESLNFRMHQKKPRSPTESDEICTLVITKAGREDSGMFTCTVSNQYGSTTSTAALTVTASSTNIHARPFSSFTVDPSQKPFPSANTANTAHSLTPFTKNIFTDPVTSSTSCLESFSSSPFCLDPNSSSMMGPDRLYTSLPSLDPATISSSCLNSCNTSTKKLDSSFQQGPPDCRRACPEPESSSSQVASCIKPFSAVTSSSEQDVSQPSLNKNLTMKGTANHQNGSPITVPLPDPPPNSCLKTGTQTNHKVSRSSSRVGLRVRFKMPEEEPSDMSSQSDEDAAQLSINKEPPPVLAKPKLDPVQLQLLHNQVLMEQQQDTDHQTPTQTQTHTQSPFQIQPEVPSFSEGPLWSPSTQHEPHLPSFQPSLNNTPTLKQTPTSASPRTNTSVPSLSSAPPLNNTTTLKQTPTSAPPRTSSSAPSLSSAPPLNNTPTLKQTPTSAPPRTSSSAPSLSSAPPLSNTTTLKQTPTSAPPRTNSFAPSLSSAPPLKNTMSDLFSNPPSSLSGSPPSVPQFKTSPSETRPPLTPQFESVPPLRVAPVTRINTIHASHLSLSPAAVASTTPLGFPPPAPKLSTSSTDSTSYLQHITSPAPLLRSTHASLTNLTATSHTFNYARPKEFIAAQTFSPVRSPSPSESPVPLLQELAAELNSSAASSPTLPMSPPPGVFPARVLRSPTSPPFLMTSPPPTMSSFLNNMFNVPPKASSPISSSSTPSPIQNPVAFLSSVLPSLTPSQPTNSMGLPRGAPLGLQKKVPKMRPQSDSFESREIVQHNIEKKLQGFQSCEDITPSASHQQKLSNKGKTGSRPLGPNIPATVFNYDEEYRVSNFEQRLMSEIEFRLERTPVQESDDEVQHDDVPTGKCIAPIFEKKLKNFRAMEGVPVTFTCKVLGIPVPKVYWFKDGMQILRKNIHFKKIREGDGTCALHIESTTNDDDGNYTVMAANPQGRISCSGHLIVQTGPPRPLHPRRVQVCIQEKEGEQTQERFFQPHFLQAPGDMLAHEGKLCRLDCKVSGLPIPELMWLVNGRPIYPDIYHRMLVRENGIHSLVIDPLTQNDDGTYTCIASNKAGQSSFSLELKVVEKEQKHPPKFLEKLQNTGIPEGAPIRLECRVVGMPHPVIFWKKDNDTISKTKERISMTQDPTGYVCLLIHPTTKDDAGWYTVSAKNEAGIVSCTCRLDIYAQWHQSIPPPIKRSTPAGSRYAALTGQGIDITSAFPTSEASPILYATSPPEARTESEEL